MLSCWFDEERRGGAIARRFFMTEATQLTRYGYRFGSSGAHSARTMMLDELVILLGNLPENSAREDYVCAIREYNILGKLTTQSRNITLRHLLGLYGLNPTIPLFRVFRRLWQQNELARPVLALCMALARDPLLRKSQNFILSKQSGELVHRTEIEQLLAQDDPDRFSHASLKSFAQNINGTWTQAGYLAGRKVKTRTLPCITPENVAFALFLSYLEGLSGQRLFSSKWMKLLSISPKSLEILANSAANRGQIILMNAGGVIEVRFPGYLTPAEEQWRHE